MPFGWIHVAIALLAAQSQPTFRTQVELLRLDVSVVDKSGQPIPDLQAGDFVVKVDGKPRTVSFARFYSSDGAPAATPATEAPPSFADNRTTTAGRVVVLVVDLESMTPGYEKLVLDTAGSLVDRLGPADSVGLILIPGKGIELTRDHARVRDALQHARGFATASDRRHVLSVREADGIVRDDKRVLAEVVDRECTDADRACSTEIDREARQLLTDADQHVRTVLTALSDLNGHLAGIDSPRTVVVLSAGLPSRPDTDSYFRDLRRRAAESGTTTYIVQLDQPETDASSVGKPGTASVPHADLTEGLSSLAGATGGSLYSGIGRAAGVFDRIRSEIVHSYQLGVDSVSADADGKTHRIDVQVKRDGAVVRARSEFITAKSAPVHRTPAEALLLPPGLAEVPLVVTVYNTRGDDAATVKLVVVLETAPGSQGAPPNYAFTITGADDKPAAQSTGAMKAQGDGAHVSVAAQVAPGRYRLRGAVVDAQGRAGSVELPIAVGMRQAGEFQFSDLVVGTPAAGFTPSSHLAPPRTLAILELTTADPAQFEGISVDLELASGETIVASGPTTVAKTPIERRRVAQGELDVPDALAPGTYVLTAVVKRHGRPLTRISRSLVR